MRPLTRDSEQTITLRMTVRARQDLVHARVAMANQLRAHLQTTLPGVIGLFRDIDSAITLRFLTRFPSQDKADWLSAHPVRQLAALDRLQPPGQPRPALGPPPRRPARHHRRRGAPPAPTITLALVAALTALRAQIKALEDQIADQLAAHPDAAIFTSLPKLRHRPRGPAAGRDRRRPRPLPDPRSTGLPGRRRPIDQTVRQGQGRHVPLGRRQTATRRRHRLRRRLPPRQPLGRRPLPTSPRPRPRPPPRHPHPGPRLAPHHLALLARPRPLRPRQTPRPTTPPTPSGLTQGYSCRDECCPHERAQAEDRLLVVPPDPAASRSCSLLRSRAAAAVTPRSTKTSSSGRRRPAGSGAPTSGRWPVLVGRGRNHQRGHRKAGDVDGHDALRALGAAVGDASPGRPHRKAPDRPSGEGLAWTAAGTRGQAVGKTPKVASQSWTTSMSTRW